jgi:hypothetical protein
MYVQYTVLRSIYVFNVWSLYWVLQRPWGCLDYLVLEWNIANEINIDKWPLRNGVICVMTDGICSTSRRVGSVFYVQVTVHRDNLRINNQQDASIIQNFILSRNSTCFGHLLCPSSGVIRCTRGNWCLSCRLCGRCLGQSGWNCSNLTLRGSNHITCMKHTNCQVCSW